MDTMTSVLVIGAAATWAMVGLIWVVQVVHYPMLAEMSALSPVTAALAVALLPTVLVQVPLHARLADAHDDDVARRLVTTNWIRTIAWTARGVVLAAVLTTT